MGNKNKDGILVRCMTMELKPTERLIKHFSEISAIYNFANYIRRKKHFGEEIPTKKPLPSFGELREHLRWLSDSDISSRIINGCLQKLNHDWNSFYGLLKKHIHANVPNYHNKVKGQGDTLPECGYYEYETYAPLIFDQQSFTKIDNETNSFCMPKSDYRIYVPKKVPVDKVKCVTMVYDKGRIKAILSYEKEPIRHENIKSDRIAGIDIGIENLLTVTTTSNVGKSWLFKGGAIKSANQFYNKLLASAKSELANSDARKKTSNRIQKIYLKRERVMENFMRNIASRLANLLIENGIGTVVVGLNKGWKSDIARKRITELKEKKVMDKKGNDKGKYEHEGFRNRKENQKALSIPHFKLLQMIKSKCEENGIAYNEVEESYTSIADHLNGEPMVQFDENGKPVISAEEQQLRKERRIFRGLYKSKCGISINADVNGAIGILRKMSLVTDDELKSDTWRSRMDIRTPESVKWWRNIPKQPLAENPEI